MEIIWPISIQYYNEFTINFLIVWKMYGIYFHISTVWLHSLFICQFVWKLYGYQPPYQSHVIMSLSKFLDCMGIVWVLASISNPYDYLLCLFASLYGKCIVQFSSHILSVLQKSPKSWKSLPHIISIWQLNLSIRFPYMGHIWPITFHMIPIFFVW